MTLKVKFIKNPILKLHSNNQYLSPETQFSIYGTKYEYEQYAYENQLNMHFFLY